MAKCLFCSDGKLQVGVIISVFKYNVLVEVVGDGTRRAIDKENIIESVSPEAYEVLQKNSDILIK